MSEEKVIKKFTIPCNFSGGAKSPVAFYIGNPNKDSHPIHFQSEWLSKERGGTVPEEIMKSLEELQKLSIKNGVPFVELCSYALEALQADTASTVGTQNVSQQQAQPVKKEASPSLTPASPTPSSSSES